MAVNSRTASRVRGAATVTLVIGLTFVAAGVEGLAAFNACLADPACLPDASVMNVEVFFAVLVVGIVLAAVGASILVAERWVLRTAST
jgi:hypothetical protein